MDETPPAQTQGFSRACAEGVFYFSGSSDKSILVLIVIEILNADDPFMDYSKRTSPFTKMSRVKATSKPLEKRKNS